MKNASKWLETAIIQIRKHDAEITRNETAILELLLEIETRKEYSRCGFDGLYSFCIKTFGWSESQTATRTQAMYALRSMPELKQKIDQGSMSITTVAQVERFIRQEQVEAGIRTTPEQRKQIFESFENKTSTEVKLEIAERKGERIKLRLALELDEEAEALWTQVRNLSAHQTQGSALNCLKVLMKSYLSKQAGRGTSTRTAQAQQSNDPARRATSSLTKVASPSTVHTVPRPDSAPCTGLASTGTTSNTTTSNTTASNTTASNTTTSNSTTSNSTTPPRTSSPNPRFIPAPVRRQVFIRDRSRCRNCESAHALQIDHIRPIAQGGTADLDNLRLLCRSCNLSPVRPELRNHPNAGKVRSAPCEASARAHVP